MKDVRVKQYQQRRRADPPRISFHEFSTHPGEARKRADLLLPVKILKTIDDVSLDEKEHEILSAHVMAILLSMSEREEWLPIFDNAMADERLTDADKRLVRLAVIEMQENDLLFG